MARSSDQRVGQGGHGGGQAVPQGSAPRRGDVPLGSSAPGQGVQDGNQVQPAEARHGRAEDGDDHLLHGGHVDRPDQTGGGAVQKRSHGARLSSIARRSGGVQSHAQGATAGAPRPAVDGRTRPSVGDGRGHDELRAPDLVRQARHQDGDHAAQRARRRQEIERGEFNSAHVRRRGKGQRKRQGRSKRSHARQRQGRKRRPGKRLGRQGSNRDVMRGMRQGKRTHERVHMPALRALQVSLLPGRTRSEGAHGPRLRVRPAQVPRAQARDAGQRPDPEVALRKGRPRILEVLGRAIRGERGGGVRDRARRGHAQARGGEGIRARRQCVRDGDLVLGARHPHDRERPPRASQAPRRHVPGQREQHADAARLRDRPSRRRRERDAHRVQEDARSCTSSKLDVAGSDRVSSQRAEAAPRRGSVDHHVPAVRGGRARAHATPGAQGLGRAQEHRAAAASREVPGRHDQLPRDQVRPAVVRRRVSVGRGVARARVQRSLLRLRQGG